MQRPSVLPLLGLASLLTACAPSAPVADPYVFVLSGQSNMVGQGTTSELPPDLSTLPPTVRLFVDGEAALITDRRSFGPEVAFAHEMARAWPERNIVLLKYAVGGTSLLAWAPQWSEAQAALTANAPAGPLYAQLMAAVRRPVLGPSARFAGLLWMQGERDARYLNVGPDYLTNLGTFLAAVRSDLEAPDLPLLLGVVNPPTDRYPAAEIVRTLQWEAPDQLSATVVVDTDGVSKRDDNLHYDTAGQLELGRRFAEAFLALESAR